MNIVELMYLSMRPFNEDLNNIGFEQYIRECRTLRIDNGRQTGKTSNLCEFIAKYNFNNVCFICHSSGNILNVKKIFKVYDELYNKFIKNSNVEFMSFNNSLEYKFRGIQYDVIIFDTYSFYKSKINFNYTSSLKKDGIVIKVG